MDEVKFLNEIGPVTEETQLVNAVYDELIELAMENDIPTSEFGRDDVEELTEKIIQNGVSGIHK